MAASGLIAARKVASFFLLAALAVITLNLTLVFAVVTLRLRKVPGGSSTLEGEQQDAPRDH